MQYASSHGLSHPENKKEVIKATSSRLLYFTHIKDAYFLFSFKNFKRRVQRFCEDFLTADHI